MNKPEIIKSDTTVCINAFKVCEYDGVEMEEYTDEPSETVGWVVYLRVEFPEDPTHPVDCIDELEHNFKTFEQASAYASYLAREYNSEVHQY